MRLNITRTIVVITFGLAMGIPTDGTAETILWCEDAERIEVENCLDERPEEGEYVPLLVEENCIGEVGVTEAEPE